jgi:CRISPR-associated protein Cas1
MITKEHFEKSMHGIVLKENGMKIFVEELENKLSTTFNHRTLGKNVSYRRLIRLELYKLEKHLIGEEEYKAFVAKW